MKKEEQAEPDRAEGVGPTYYIAPCRTGKSKIGAYLDPVYKQHLRLIQAQTNKSIQSLLQEALDDLYEKYGKPSIRHD